ncbi:O-methyltransferase [Vibrio gazogenes]|uniref:Predicted O-methyltransferase YrrM n=1 Tax=Vibrio gazogenes DSM 21264 = NBRC 103151 TaxID=1123492 RepID=A0A1M4TDP9_VIBGA|nr:O-methyltransferase [Vibrio gazogenes]USP16074.1 O-methyltransferase [Vibrio gazogenes]SHE42669.1 Predicted O-methyltransferase YrrM [Vibrio gazogenes DSM 21264] [Vibrio gazogenes DSM 21264 = NBRC 103151]SJN54253.1 Putative O-methyltransferase/MSMEI_4947 [Vibrio gazogenes]
MERQKIMAKLERLGIENDQAQSDKSKKYLNITRDTGEFLSVLVKATGANQILEIGTSNGYSTIWLASALQDSGMVYTVEANLEKVREASVNFASANVSSKVTQLVGDISEVLTDVPEQMDFIFLDADRKTYVALAERLFQRLKPGGLLVCDNATSHQDELEAFTCWLSHQSNLSTSLVPVGKGELLVYKS